MSNTIGHVWAVNAEGGDEGRPSTVGPVYIENIDKLGSQIPDPEAGDAGKVLGVLNSSGDIGWVVAQEGIAQVQSDWTEQDSTKASFIVHKPNMADYATAQSLEQGLAGKQDVIDDLSDIRSGATAGSTAVQPGELATVALSGDYGDLRNRPSIPVVDQTYSPDSVNAQSGVAIASAISGKQDTIADLADIRSGAAEGATAVQPGDLAAVATSGSYNDLLDKPTIPPGVTVDQVYDPSSANAQSGTAVAGAIGNVKQVPGATSADNGKVLGVTDTSGTVGWITPAPGVTVDQTYNPNSTNPQSGTAVAGAIGDVKQVPSSNAGDANKILKVNAQGTPEWATDVDTTYSAGTGLSLSGTTFNVVNPVPAAVTADNGKMLGVTDTSGNIGWVTPPSLPATKPLVAGTNITITENANDVTISAAGGASYSAGTGIDITNNVISADTTVLATKSDLSSYTPTASLATVATTGAYSDLSGTPTINNVPAVTSSDDDKVLKASYSGGVGSYSWEAEPTILGLTAGSNVTITEANNAVTIAATDTTYTAGNMISIDSNNSNAIGVSTTAGITDIQLVNALPASPVATVLYIIPET